jgi:two-component system, LuxR family, response regulator FixJ
LTDEPTVFLIGDDSAALRALATVVKVVFPRIVTFPSAADFLAAYRHQPGCLVFDVATSGIDGLEPYRKLIPEQITLPVVFVARQGNVRMAVGAMQLGAVNFLEKPVREQELWDSIRKALELDAQSRRRLARRHRAEERLVRLTVGEREVLNLILEGKRNKEIAAKLSLSTRTIEDRRAKLMMKLGARSLAELVQLVLAH